MKTSLDTTNNQAKHNSEKELLAFLPKKKRIDLASNLTLRNTIPESVGGINRERDGRGFRKINE